MEPVSEKSVKKLAYGSLASSRGAVAGEIAMKQGIGILGGTFDPIHIGHLRAGLEALQALRLESVHFIPCQQPVHRKHPLANAEHRANMISLAIDAIPEFALDTRELNRSTPSYMFETLTSLRDEVGKITPLYLLIGMDVFQDFDTWHAWEKLIDLVHIVVLSRDALSWPETGPLKAFVQKKKAPLKSLLLSPAGNLTQLHIPPLGISATAIRQAFKNKQNPHFLLPPPVIAYILQHKLFQNPEIAV